MKPIAENRRARFDYEILETFEAGIALTGQEVKSAKGGHFNLNGSYAVPRHNELWLINAAIPAYQPKNAPADYDPSRVRRLLLHQNEIKSLIGKLQQKSFSLIPLRAYLKNNFIKLELGLGKSRKKSNKREVLKKRDSEREIRRLE